MENKVVTQKEKELVLARLGELSTPVDRLEEVTKRVSALIDAAAEAATRGHIPDFAAALADVYA